MVATCSGGWHLTHRRNVDFVDHRPHQPATALIYLKAQIDQRRFALQRGGGIFARLVLDDRRVFDRRFVATAPLGIKVISPPENRPGCDFRYRFSRIGGPFVDGILFVIFDWILLAPSVELFKD
jgi:hypothetical protein